MLTYGVLRWIGMFGAVDAGALGQLVQQVRGAVGAGVIDNLVQGLHPLRCFLRIEVHNPLIQFLVHGYFHYKGLKRRFFPG